MLEGISAESIRSRALTDAASERFAPKKDVAAHLLPFFKANVNNEIKTFVQWDTAVSSDVTKPVELHPINDLKDLQSHVLYTYNYIIIYGIEQKTVELSETQKKHMYRFQLQELELQQMEIKKRKQELKDKLSSLNKRNKELK